MTPDEKEIWVVDAFTSGSTVDATLDAPQALEEPQGRDERADHLQQRGATPISTGAATDDVKTLRFVSGLRTRPGATCRARRCSRSTPEASPSALANQFGIGHVPARPIGRPSPEPQGGPVESPSRHPSPRPIRAFATRDTVGLPRNARGTSCEGPPIRHYNRGGTATGHPGGQ